MKTLNNQFILKLELFITDSTIIPIHNPDYSI